MVKAAEWRKADPTMGLYQPEAAPDPETQAEAYADMPPDVQYYGTLHGALSRRLDAADKARIRRLKAAVT